MNESKVFLIENASNDAVEASLFDGVLDEHLALWDQEWSPAMQLFVQES